MVYCLPYLQTKGNEINALILTLPPILEFLEDNQRKEVDSKVEEMHERWIQLKNILENRLDLARIYVKFHMEADIVNKEMDHLESDLLQNRDRVTDELLRNLEEKWESLVPLYQSAKNTGLTFMDQANKVKRNDCFQFLGTSNCFVRKLNYSIFRDVKIRTIMSEICH